MALESGRADKDERPIGERRIIFLSARSPEGQSPARAAAHAGRCEPRLLGHWGTTPGLNFLYVHWNRLIRERDLNMIYIIGPGHGGPGLVANTYLEGSYTEIYPHIEQNKDGIKRLFRQFSWPTAYQATSRRRHGFDHEAASWATRWFTLTARRFDNPNLIVACVVGDGEAETGPLRQAGTRTNFLTPRPMAQVLPILHLNGYKIANPTILARIPHAELESLIVATATSHSLLKR